MSQEEEGEEGNEVHLGLPCGRQKNEFLLLLSFRENVKNHHPLQKPYCGFRMIFSSTVIDMDTDQNVTAVVDLEEEEGEEDEDIVEVPVPPKPPCPLVTLASDGEISDQETEQREEAPTPTPAV